VWQSGEVVVVRLNPPARLLHQETIAPHLAMHLIRKGQIRWLHKGDVLGQRQFIHNIFGIAA